METKAVTVNAAAALLNAADNIQIVMHRLPDCDTIGSGAALLSALKGMGKHVLLFCKDEIPALYTAIFEDLTVYHPGQALPFLPTYTVSVDIASPALFGKGMEETAQHTDLCIDHHALHTPFARHSLIIPKAAAACEIMFDLLCAMGARITPQIATCLYCGIATDTGCFRHSNVTPHTFETAGKLLQLGADAAKVNYLLFDTKSAEKLALEQYIFSHLQMHFDNRCSLFILPASVINAIGAKEEDLNDLSNLGKVRRGVDISVMLRQTAENCYKVSVRTTQQSGLDAAKICALYQGGGHARAAGCTLQTTAQNAVQRMLQAVASFLYQTEETLS